MGLPGLRLFNNYQTKPSSATGDISFTVTWTFLRTGHIVYGWTRSESKANRLAAEESTCLNLIRVCCAHDEPTVTPTVCQPTDIDKWKHFLAAVEAVINVTRLILPKMGSGSSAW